MRRPSAKTESLSLATMADFLFFLKVNIMSQGEFWRYFDRFANSNKFFVYIVGNVAKYM